MKEYTLEELQKGRLSGACCRHLASMDALQRSVLYNELVFERLQRKYNDILEIYRLSEEEWNQTYYTLLFRVIGGPQNKRAFDKLSRLVPYNVLLRVISSQASLEAILLGSAGLLDLYNDSYIQYLKKEFEYLKYKYNIEPMDVSEWNTIRIFPNNHPTLRLVQIASSLHNNNISIRRATLCSTRHDVYNIFDGTASEDWIKRVHPGRRDSKIVNHIGHTKCDILGINLIAQINFAYGNYIQSDQLIDNAIALLENIPCEDNRYTRHWNSESVVAQNAFEGQAVLQLSTEYCERNRCQQCPLAALLCPSLKE